MRWSRSTGAVLFIVLFVAVFLAPELIGGRIASSARLAEWRPWSGYVAGEVAGPESFNPDCLTSYHPRRALLHSAWRDGELPLWNPYSFCGMPFLADPQAQVLYPPSWLLLPFDPGRALGLFLFLHLAWAGVGMWLLLRRQDVPPGAAVLGGCAFALSGFFAKHFGSPSFLAVAAWLPWVFLATDHVVRRPGVATAARLALVGAMTFLAGQPQIALMAAYAALIYAGIHAATSGAVADRRAIGRVSLALAAAGGLAVLIVGAQLLPTLELAARSARMRLPFDTVLSGAFHPVEAIRFLVPDFFGTPVTRDEWSGLFPLGDSFYWRIQLNSVFAGTSVFLFALIGMFHPRTWRRALPFTVVTLLAVLVAFGTPLARWAHALLPGFALARLDRAGAILVFAQFVPAGLAATQLGRGGSWSGRRLLGGLLIALAAVGVWLVSAAGSGLPAALGAEWAPPPGGTLSELARTPGRTLLAALFGGSAGIVLLLPARPLTTWLPFALAAAQLFLFATPYRGDRDPSDVFAAPPDIAVLRESLAGDAGGYRFVRFGRSAGRGHPVSGIMPPSTNAPHGIRDVQGYNALVDRRLGDMMQQATGENLFTYGNWGGRRIVSPERPVTLRHPILAALSVGVVASDQPMAVPGWQPVASPRTFHLARNERALPRVRLTPSGRGVPEAALAQLLRRADFDPAEEVLWLGEGQAGTPGTTPRAAELLADTRNRQLIRTNAEEEAVLVIADSHDPGWMATIDGRPAPILPAWGVVRAVVVPPGLHHIELRYRPRSFRNGCVLSLLGLGLALAALALARPVGELEGRAPVP